MYPLLELGPLRLSSGGLVLLAAALLGSRLIERNARSIGGEALATQAERSLMLVLAAALIGARLWYGLFNWDLYGQTPRLFWALRIADFAWPGALLGGILAAILWCRWQRADLAALGDSTALALPLPQAIASVGLLLSGEAFGVPTGLPWGVPLFGTMRHPTQLYLAVAALLTYILVRRLAAHRLPRGTLFASYLGLQGTTFLFVEALRADALLLPGGIRAAQVLGLVLILWALQWFRRRPGRAATTLHPIEEACQSLSGQS